MIGAIAYRELQKRFFRERSTPLSIIIDQSVIRDNITSLFNLIEMLTRTVNEIQEEAEKMTGKINRIGGMENEIFEEDDESSSV